MASVFGWLGFTWVVLNQAISASRMAGWMLPGEMLSRLLCHSEVWGDLLGVWAMQLLGATHCLMQLVSLYIGAGPSGATSA